MLDFFKYPGTSYTGPAYHHCGNPAFVETAEANFSGINVAVADDGNMHPGIVADFGNQRPVGFAGIHLAAGAPVNTEGCDAAILQTLGQIDNYFGLLVPAQAGFDRHRNFYGIYHGACDFEHEGNVVQ
jgi:hypothetical protein